MDNFGHFNMSRIHDGFKDALRPIVLTPFWRGGPGLRIATWAIYRWIREPSRGTLSRGGCVARRSSLWPASRAVLQVCAHFLVSWRRFLSFSLFLRRLRTSRQSCGEQAVVSGDRGNWGFFFQYRSSHMFLRCHWCSDSAGEASQSRIFPFSYTASTGDAPNNAVEYHFIPT